MTLPTLATAIDAILDGMLTALTTQQGTGGTLTDVISIQRGDRSLPKPDVPAIYITPKAMRSTTMSTKTREWWSMPVSIGVMVKNEVAADGYQAATDLAARARKVLLGRLTSLTYTKKPVSGAFECSTPHMREQDYFRAMAEVIIEFEVEET